MSDKAKVGGDRNITLGFVDLMRDESIPMDRSRGYRVVLEACVLARNCGNDLSRGGFDKHSES